MDGGEFIVHIHLDRYTDNLNEYFPIFFTYTKMIHISSKGISLTCFNYIKIF